MYVLVFEHLKSKLNDDDDDDGDDDDDDLGHTIIKSCYSSAMIEINESPNV